MERGFCPGCGGTTCGSCEGGAGVDAINGVYAVRVKPVVLTFDLVGTLSAIWLEAASSAGISMVGPGFQGHPACQGWNLQSVGVGAGILGMSDCWAKAEADIVSATTNVIMCVLRAELMASGDMCRTALASF